MDAKLARLMGWSELEPTGEEWRGVPLGEDALAIMLAAIKGLERIAAGPTEETSQ